jgi:hypothetical protein
MAVLPQMAQQTQVAALVAVGQEIQTLPAAMVDQE